MVATVNKLDAAEVGAVDATGNVVRSYCAQGVPWVAGFDRPEIYVDPWGVDPSDPAKQRLYLVTRCSRTDDDSEVLFKSNDSGAHWSDSTIRLGGGSAAVTMTSSGRMYILQGTTMFISDDQGKTLSTVSFGENPPVTGFDISATGLPIAALQGTETGIGPPFVAPEPIATVGPSSVLAVYPSVETVPGTTENRQVAVVVLVAVPKKEDPTPLIVTPLMVVRAQAEKGSVLMPSFITDTRPRHNPVSMLYWLETTNKPANPGTDAAKVMARYVMFAGAGRTNASLSSLAWQMKRS